MKIDLSSLISVISVLIAIISITMAIKNSIKKDTKDDVSQSTSMMIELKYISSGISEIKNQITNLKEDIDQLRDKTIVHGESIKEIFRKITAMEKDINFYHKK